MKLLDKRLVKRSKRVERMCPADRKEMFQTTALNIFLTATSWFWLKKKRGMMAEFTHQTM